MYFDLALLACVLSLLHVTLFFFMGHKKLELTANLFALLGLVLTTIQYVMLYKTPIPPFESLTGVLLLLSMALFIGYFAMYIKYKRPSIGLFVFPLAIIFVMLSRFSSGVEMAGDSVVVTFWLYIHLPFTILGTAFFMLSTLTGVMYFIQERQLKNKNFGIIFRRFPPLDTINNLNNTTLYIGFYTFTIGLLAGVVWMFYSSGRVNFYSTKLVFALITWIIYSSITFYKQFRGMSPKYTALSTIVGFISVLVTYVGVAFFVMG
ncbi:MAG: hypothetical protein C0602_04495 [Denitrovibrio sp.]|nr:MAG: hypothetical protein C0602_04495 [Denitrovibrio sp.]